ncbi:N-acetyl-D-muramate 6-phosphate phosphatase [Methylomarinovum caldicuralii]|uniref:N-acetyl-D-muramate 6-phosphate phosphatase n=1 Tax=Methylomarinovum caldicuralii TaxID=438856 RepID=A0AAU9CNR5_9GAMM|nr:HAD-IA family hydrolase [Methylomarinovum caldicuralii]BCX81162.1 N-acetyl-D-muramate 6-phosphate phosphatase [Methylomarinovum caldicuralii]
MTLQCILFDLDGTLLDTLPDLALAVNTMLTEEGRQPLAEAVIRRAVSDGAPGMVQLAFGEDQDKEDFARRMARLREVYLDHLTDRTHLFPGMETVLEDIEGRGLKWGIVTNKRRYMTIPLLRELGLLAQTDAVVCGDDTPLGKPNPQPLWLACREAGVEATRCVYIGDAARDIEAGRRAGMITVAVGYGYLAPGDKPEHWGADHLIEQPGDIHSLLEGWLPAARPAGTVSAA